MKNTFKFKAIFKIAGLILIVAMIGFSFTACGGIDDSTWELLDETKWEKGENSDPIMLYFYSQSSNPKWWFQFGNKDGGGAESSSITSLTSDKVVTSSGPSFNFKISGDTIIITNWSVSSEATKWNGTYTKQK